MNCYWRDLLDLGDLGSHNLQMRACYTHEELALVHIPAQMQNVTGMTCMVPQGRD